MKDTTIQEQELKDYHELTLRLTARIRELKAEVANYKRGCDGCMHRGLYENEFEYGVPSPCTLCKRRCGDFYKEGQE